MSGRPDRFKVGYVTLGLDGEWRKGMSLSDRAAVTILTWPLLLRRHRCIPSSNLKETVAHAL